MAFCVYVDINSCRVSAMRLAYGLILASWTASDAAKPKPAKPLKVPDIGTWIGIVSNGEANGHGAFDYDSGDSKSTEGV